MWIYAISCESVKVLIFVAAAKAFVVLLANINENLIGFLVLKFAVIPVKFV